MNYNEIVLQIYVFTNWYNTTESWNVVNEFTVSYLSHSVFSKSFLVWEYETILKSGHTQTLLPRFHLRHHQLSTFLWSKEKVKITTDSISLKINTNIHTYNFFPLFTHLFKYLYIYTLEYKMDQVVLVTDP